MTSTDRHDAWQASDNYERYMGRWSRRIAPLFLDWLGPPAGADWLEVGCGTGALTATIVARCGPKRIVAIDPSAGFVETARTKLPDPRVEFAVGDAQHLEGIAGSTDVVVSGLVLNFVPDRARAMTGMARAARPGGTVAFYVWDYPNGGVAFMLAFWTAAAELDPAAADLSEDRRFPFCTVDGLSALAQDAGLASIETTTLETPTVFASFDDYWQPFTLGTGPAPGYCASLAPDARERLRSKLSDDLPRAPDGSIHLAARAIAVKGRVA